MLIVIGPARFTGINQELGDVLSDAPVIRSIARMDEPSQSIERIWARLATGSLFMPAL
jgi:hypothetical protein